MKKELREALNKRMMRLVTNIDIDLQTAEPNAHTIENYLQNLESCIDEIRLESSCAALAYSVCETCGQTYVKGRAHACA